MEEAKIQNQFLAESILKAGQMILGPNMERLPQIVKVFGEICQKKQSDAETLEALSVIIANMSQDAAIAEQFKSLCDSQLNEEEKARVLDTYNKCNEEIRSKVMARIAWFNQ